MNHIKDKADIARANGSDPTPWAVIVFIIATAVALAAGYLYL